MAKYNHTGEYKYKQINMKRYKNEMNIAQNYPRIVRKANNLFQVGSC